MSLSPRPALARNSSTLTTLTCAHMPSCPLPQYSWHGITRSPGSRNVVVKVATKPGTSIALAFDPATLKPWITSVLVPRNVTGTNANVMLVPGFVATFTTTFKKPGEHAMPCHEYCGSGHEGMWAHVQVVSADEFRSRASRGERLACVPR